MFSGRVTPLFGETFLEITYFVWNGYACFWFLSESKSHWVLK